MDAVDQVLAQRASRHAGSPQWASLGAAVLLHAAVVAVALLLPRLEKPPEPLQFVPVTVMPAQALGVERPLARPNPMSPASPPKAETPPSPPPAAKPEPAPEPPKPKPAPEKPQPAEKEPPVDRRPALPEPAPAPTKKPPPKPAEKPGKGTDKTPRPADAHPQPAQPSPPSQGHAGPGGVAAVGKGDEIGRRGSAAGSPIGTSGLGSQIAGVEDPDFGYGYYLDRLLQLIDANWTRPPLGSGVRTILHFRILKDGTIDELRVEESSGYNSFDLAALRAVQNASPPALPASYRHDSLGISLIVR